MYGEPIAASSNGLNFIFKKKTPINSRECQEEQLKNFLTVCVVHINVFGIFYIKEISMYESIVSYFKKGLGEITY